MFRNKPKAENINVKDRLTIEIIDKKTGKVVSRETSERSLGDSGSTILINFIAGKFSDANQYKDWKYVYLFDSAKNIIKHLTGTWGAVGIGANYNYCVLTVTDDSSDAYSTAFQGLYYRTDAEVLGQMCIWQQQYKTKGSDQILRITWEVRVPYVSVP
jgi:hypothetical protein